MATILDGKAVAAAVRAEVKEKTSTFTAETGVVPHLTVVLVGDDPASAVYVRNKEKASAEAGFAAETLRLPTTTTQAELNALIDRLNSDPQVHGILVQLPLPDGLSDTELLDRINPDKDVDAFHPVNVGRLMVGRPRFLPCTPAGILELLHRYGIDPAGKRCVVVGRSNIVGKPMAQLLLAENGTVTVCHSKTRELATVTREADILIVAIGRADFIGADMVKPGATVIDVGMNRNREGKLTGDVDFAAVSPIAGAITPVPGGVGPMTIAMLMKNTLTAAKLAVQKNKNISGGAT